MIKKVFIFLVIGIFVLINTSVIFAAEKDPGDECIPNVDTCRPKPEGTYSCLPAPNPPPAYLCQRDVFGKIQAPDAIKRFLGADQTGASGISKFLSNLIVLIYSIASIALIFMILWAAFEWLTSGGDKEKVAAARARLTYAIVGMILFAIAFAVIQVLGTFTGFKFFEGQGMTIINRWPHGTEFQCPDGKKYFVATGGKIACP